MMDWTEKYRPKSLKDVLGNPSSVNALRGWAEAWKSGVPKVKVAVIMGPPGIGKTTSALALASEMGWDVVELNASDQRTGSILEEIALTGSKYASFSMDGTFSRFEEGSRKLIILDEADDLDGNADRGAYPVIKKLITESRQPVVMIVNDFYPLKRKCPEVDVDELVCKIVFSKVTAASMAKVLSKIAAEEGVELEPGVVEAIIENDKGDMRAAVRDLESYSLGNSKVTLDMVEGISSRDKTNDMFSFTSSVFMSSDPMKAKNMLINLDEEPRTVEMWVDENLPYQYRSMKDLVMGLERVSRADIMIGRVFRRQYYRLWAYANDLLTYGINTARSTKSSGFEKIRFPSALKRMSGTRDMRSVKKGVCLKLAIHLHTTTKRVSMDILPAVKYLMSKDKEFTICMTRDLGLEPEELAFLTDKKADSKYIKTIFEELKGVPETEEKPEKKTSKKVAKAMEAPEKADKPVMGTKEANTKNQASLMDF